MAGNTPQVLSKSSQDGIIQFCKQSYSLLNNQWNIREQYRQIDLAYMRELDYTKENLRAKLSNRLGDPTKFQNVTVPVVMPQVESAVTYQASVFLTGIPIFGWVGAPGDETAALQYQAITEENSIRGGWVQQFMIGFRDMFKYNLGLIEVVWDRVNTAAIETDLTFTTGKQGKSKNTIWQGNCIKRWDPYNTFWDSRYKPTEVYKYGDFIGTTELMTRIRFKAFVAELPDKMAVNLKDAFESGIGGPSTGTGGIESFYIPQLNPDALIISNPRQAMDWMSWAGMNERPKGEPLYRNLYEVTTIYARIIPQDFNLRVPSANTVQIWKFILVNHQVLIYAERQTNAHNYLPVLIGQPNEDGLGYQTKSLGVNARPFQDIESALVNSAMAARRRAISDRGIYNPLLISSKDINSDSPTAKIPMRPGGYNKKPEEAYYAIPFRDDQSGTAFQEMAQIDKMAMVVNGQNPAKQGQFTKGNRTQSEYQSIMANANGRDQTTSMMLEAQLFTPLKEILKINILQYQPAGDIYSPSQKAVVKIDPVQLRKSFVAYKISDGLTPTDKLIGGDEWALALQTIGSSETIGGAYNVGPMFSYIMKIKNVDLSTFEKPPEQIAYEQALQAWQNTVVQMAKQMGDTFDPKKIPPQPLPQQYNYTPGQTAAQPGQSQPTNLAQQTQNNQGGAVPNG